MFLFLHLCIAYLFYPSSLSFRSSPQPHLRIFGACNLLIPSCGSDVNKDSGHKAKAKAKDSSIKAKAKAKDSSRKAKAKDLTKVSKAKAKDLSIVSKAKAKDLQ